MSRSQRRRSSGSLCQCCRGTDPRRRYCKSGTSPHQSHSFHNQKRPSQSRRTHLARKNLDRAGAGFRRSGSKSPRVHAGCRFPGPLWASILPVLLPDLPDRPQLVPPQQEPFGAKKCYWEKYCCWHQARHQPFGSTHSKGTAGCSRIQNRKRLVIHYFVVQHAAGD